MIRVAQAGRRYDRRWAIRHVDLVVDPGEMMGIVGADGAGKTTLLQMCAAILDPSEGACRVFGFDTVRDADAVTSRIGYMSQGFTLYDRLTVAENLRLSARLRDVPRDAFAERRARLLQMAGLSAFDDRPAGKLSGGMRKKLALCTNLIHEPRLLILDEPGLGVDPLSRRQLWEMLDSFRAQGITIVVATSYMEEAEHCDRILLLQEGSPLAVDTPAAVRQTAAGRVYEVPADDPDQAAAALERDPDVFGIRVLPDRIRFQLGTGAATPRATEALAASARSVSPTLEDIFVLHGGRSADGAGDATADLPLGTRGEIAADRVTVSFGRFRAVDGVSLEAGPGSLLALLGPNGAGKTTLIRAFCGLVPLSEGVARIGDVRVVPGAHAIRERIGYMSQHFSLYPDLTLGENLAFFAAAYGIRRTAAAGRIGWASAMTGLADTPAETPVSALSGATRQRLALACSILHWPSVLFLDEPTSGVDPVARYRFWRLIRSLAGAGMVVIVTTHYLNEAEYCDRIGLMHQGRLIAIGSLAELRRQTGSGDAASVEDVFVGAIRRAQDGAS